MDKRFISLIFLSMVFFIGCSNSSKLDSSSNTKPQKQSNAISQSNNNLTFEKSEVYSNLLMVNKTTGWIVRNNVVLRTINGGLDWNDVSPYSNSKTNDTQSIVSTYFYDSNIAWVSFGNDLNDGNKLIVYHTTDGGGHWEKESLPAIEDWEGTGNENINFIDPSNGFILVTSQPALGQMNKSIYKTNNGGKSWLRIGTITNKIPSYPTGLTFKNSREGWITSSNHGENYITTFKTDDGGYSWHKENLQMVPVYKDYYTNSYPPVFLNNEKKFGILPIEYVNEKSRFIIPYITNDGGNSWTATKSLSNYDLSHYDFINEKQWLAIDNKENKLYETSNGGNSFEELSQNEIFKGIKTLDFISNQIGWAIGDNFFIKTIDGGKNWTKININK
ncbi:WD40/YVTN/BNR-like repeat-containing protein [Candidatus Clostridium radicumherbarum]|uniref:WD40/YVTN/BNR-like repeat-containing protein n=1 Tax=Candidatus Clostridium radicumherbarum TaxID=3381662 RepID=A0ABW8TU68_9CLOT